MLKMRSLPRKINQCTFILIIQSRLNNCGHKFCFKCIDRWSKVFLKLIQKINNCPFCRERFTSIITKQKFRKNSKIVREGRLKKHQNPDNNQLINGISFKVIDIKLVYVPTIYLMPFPYYSFPLCSMAYPLTMPRKA